ncbi:MAG: GatB/YqeY domain-containing protein [Gammaproteobacteria bacterium]|nr:GatB/YqeY domain-containing protein [Gammaproteobacteria bacterium]NNC96636.1 GatB/YqeY domain-containing protein [Gammaproteobacteria bacterium]
MSLKETIKAEVIKAMKSKQKERLATLRMVTAAIKQIEVDERVELDDARTLAVLEKMTKQRKDSIAQFEKAGRDDLVQIEKAELAIIGEFMPAALTPQEVTTLIEKAIADTGAASMKDMGKVMGIVRASTSGLDDMGAISGMIKAKLGA